MMTQAFYSGISGIRTHQTAIDITSNNIANVSTTGYRQYNTEFASLFEKSLHTTGSNPVNSSIGVGSRVNASIMDTSTGSLKLSDRSTDLAIWGDGWFGIAGNGDTLYTRAGDFSFDKNNDLVTPQGYYVLGTMANNIVNGQLVNVITDMPLANAGEQQNLRFPENLTFPAVPTTQAEFFANIGFEDVPRSISASVIDANGVKNNLQLTFTKQAVQTPPGMQWDVVAQVKSLDGNQIYSTQNGQVNFDATGALINSTLSSIDNNGTSVAMNLGSGYSGIVATNSTVSSGYSIADGKIAGELIGYEINRNAEIIATFTNGMQSSVGKIGVYHFQNNQG
ncbi:MAG: flagellar hook-basal body complex protein, partial [Sulfurimonadaceae bacterium]|nr:flagellar hook-basal body complex protein [Sulfurimonadaceae bacterium]